MSVKLGINIDHVATLREARKIVSYPDPVKAAIKCEKAGCDSIVCHLREDRRHIKDQDVKDLRKAVKTRFNLEMSASRGIVEIALRIKPDQVTLVPEKREEVTTEGGLDVLSGRDKLAKAIKVLQKGGIAVSLFIDPIKEQIAASQKIGAKIIELHTGRYCNAAGGMAKKELNDIKDSVRYATGLGIIVNAGHGLNYDNVKPVAAIKGINELNIGHSIIARSVFVGLENAVREMKSLLS